MTVAPAAKLGLAAQMREGSQAEHQDAEGSSFMAALLDGKIQPAGYAVYLSMLQPIYAALESAAESLADDPIASAVIDPALYRHNAITRDLDHWAPQAVPAMASKAVDDYVNRINQTVQRPEFYLAHHYTRYLGDLSGGQAIGRVLSRTYGLESSAGVEFYEFTAIPKPKPYKDAYRARLDALLLSEEQQAQIVAEVREVFNLNGAIFQELSQDLPSYLVESN